MFVLIFVGGILSVAVLAFIAVSVVLGRLLCLEGFGSVHLVQQAITGAHRRVVRYGMVRYGTAEYLVVPRIATVKIRHYKVQYSSYKRKWCSNSVMIV